MAYPQMGNLYPSEAGFKTPGMYEAFLTSEGKAKAAFLADMDQFFAQLTETTRQFNETLGFKNKELASRETLTREGYDLQRELQDEQLEYQKWRDQEYFGIENKKLNQTGMNYLGGPTRKDLVDMAQKNFETKYGINRGTGETSSSRFYTVDYRTGSLRGARAGELYNQVTDQSEYGQGGSPQLSSASGVSDFESYNWYDKIGA